MGLTMTGGVINWVLLAINKVNNNRAIFEVRSPIKIQSTPHPELVKLLSLTVSVVDWYILPEAGRFTTVLRSRPPQPSDPCYISGVWCSLLICYGKCVFSNVRVDQNWKLKFIQFFDWFENCDIHDNRSLVRNLWEILW